MKSHRDKVVSGYQGLGQSLKDDVRNNGRLEVIPEYIKIALAGSLKNWAVSLSISSILQ